MPLINLDDERIVRNAAFIREAFDSREWVMGRLAEAGFDDLSDHEMVILAALGRQVRLQVMADLMLGLGITDRAIGDATGRLVESGYLAVRVNPDMRGRKMIVPTPKGRGALRRIAQTTRLKRWSDLPVRDGDIVICCVPKSGTTWMQMICALLIFQTPVLPGPLQELSPWPDWDMTTRDEVLARLEAQQHRRFMKTHRRLGELPMDPRVTYIVVGRRPLDAALSFYHQIRTAEAENGDARRPADYRFPWPNEVLRYWMGLEKAPDGFPEESPMPDMMAHLCDSWARRDQPNVDLLHYDDLIGDLEGQMRGLAARLGITVPEATWPSLVKAATFDEMRAVADQVQPVLDMREPERFFRSGTSGGGGQVLTSAELAHYHQMVARLAPPDLLAWLHGEDSRKSNVPD